MLRLHDHRDRDLVALRAGEEIEGLHGGLVVDLPLDRLAVEPSPIPPAGSSPSAMVLPATQPGASATALRNSSTVECLPGSTVRQAVIVACATSSPRSTSRRTRW